MYVFPQIFSPQISRLARSLTDFGLIPQTVSGLSAAHTVYLNGGNVLVLDKQSE